MLSSGSSLISRRRKRENAVDKKTMRGFDLNVEWVPYNCLTFTQRRWWKRKAVGRLDHRDGMAFNVVRSPCASSWVKKQQKQQAIESEKINKEWKNGGNQKRRWWNDETRGLAWAHSERSRVMYVLYTEGKEAVRQAKNKDSRTDVNHVGVSNALSSLSAVFSVFFLFFFWFPPPSQNG